MKSKQNYKSRFRILKGGKISLVISSLLTSITISFAAPSGGTVTSGTANIAVSGATTTISQSTSKASINWQDFSISSNETVNFVQPDINSITLNKVIGTETSIIDGALNATGQVWIINSNGVLFGKNASINTAGLLASTKDLSLSDFNTGNYNFTGTSTASVINLGTINSSDSSYAVLLADLVSNEGRINVVKGKVHLIGASDVTINLNGNSLVNLTVNKGVLDAYVENKGAIYANAGEIYLTTNTVDELLKGVVNNTGILEANSLDGITGKIEMFAHGGEVEIGGSISALDGFIETSGETFTMIEGIEIQADEWLIDPTDITIESGGSTSDLGSSSISASFIESRLNSGIGVSLQATNDINVNEEISWNSSRQLFLRAGNDININQDISWNNGKLLLKSDTNNININAVMTATSSAELQLIGTVLVGLDENGFKGRVDLGIDTIKVGTSTYTVINKLGSITGLIDLQNINTNLYGNYVLGSNLDASLTSTWNSGKGFIPLGTYLSEFEGMFDGLGHTITNLTINNEYSNSNYAGLFGRTWHAEIKNIGLINASIFSNGDSVGGIVGFAERSSVSNSYVTGVIGGKSTVGGIIGKTDEAKISNSFSNVTVTANGNYAGGLVGYLNRSSILNSFSNATVKAESNNGGLAGASGSSDIDNSYSTGYVFGENRTGGLVGYFISGDITNSYSTVEVSGDTNTGGLIGYKLSAATINNSYYDKTINPDMDDEDDYGKTTTQLQTASTFSSWDMSADSLSGNYPTFTTTGSSNIWEIINKEENTNTITSNMKAVIATIHNQNTFSPRNTINTSSKNQLSQRKQEAQSKTETSQERVFLNKDSMIALLEGGVNAPSEEDNEQETIQDTKKEVN